jgi:hypothetical protein
MLRRLAAILCVLVVGCAGEEEVPEIATPEGLAIGEIEGGVAGSFTAPGVEIEFSSRMVDDNTLEVLIEIGDKMLTASVDYARRIFEVDGFTVSTGEDTQMGDDGRYALSAFAQALSLLGNDVPFAMDKLRGFAATFSENPDTVPLQRIHYGDRDRDWQSLCYAVNTYQSASHDCQYAGWWNDVTSLSGQDIGGRWGGAYLSFHGHQGGQDGTRFWIPSPNHYRICENRWYGACEDKWVYFGYSGWNGAQEISHDDWVEGAYGNCFGVCGGDCAGTDLTVDCKQHDQCVRNGHSTASAYCDDQYATASDDWAFAPNCSWASPGQP